jgi:hypothetical protein
MAGQSMFGAGTALVAGLPWLKSATVSLWRVSIMVLYAIYTLGSFGIYVRQVFR